MARSTGPQHYPLFIIRQRLILLLLTKLSLNNIPTLGRDIREKQEVANTYSFCTKYITSASFSQLNYFTIDRHAFSHYLTYNTAFV